MIERFIDYLQVSINYPQQACREQDWKIIPPVKFYKIGYEDENKARYYFGNPNSSKALVILSGSVLQSFRDAHNDDASIIGSFLSKGGKCTRLDIAITEYIETELITLDDVETWYKKGKIISTWCDGGCKSLVDVPKEGENATQTIYIGNMEQRHKKGIFRAYDKGVEMGLGQFMVTRLEVEDRGDKAQATAKRIAETNDIAGNFRARFDVNDEQFERLMQSPVADITRGAAMPKRDEIEARNARWLWLINQVAPGIKQAIIDDKKLDMDDAMLTRFLAKSGLVELMQHTAKGIANQMYVDKLEKNGLL